MKESSNNYATPDAEAIEVLNLFIIKAEALKSSSLIQSFEKKKGSEVETEDGVGTATWLIDSSVLDSEYIDAFLLTLRMFIQDNDRISVRNIGKLIASLNVTPTTKEEFAKWRKKLNDFLDQKCRFVIFDEKPSNRDVLETILYGFHGHSNRSAYRKYIKWTKGPLGKVIAYFEFMGVISILTKIIMQMSHICKQALKELGG